jgi:GGDEF domain-containing protein
VLLSVLLASALQGITRFFSLAFVPLILLISAELLFYLQPLRVSHFLQGLPWLPLICLGVACVIAWQFGRSRLVWLAFILFAALVSIDPQWMGSDALIQGRSSFIILAISCLLLGKDKGFSLRNLLPTLLIMTFLAVFSVWLLPFFSNYPILQRDVLTPLTARIFDLWPSLEQWYSTNELLLILLSTVVVFICAIRRVTNSQIALLISWASYLFAMTHRDKYFDNLWVCVIAVVIVFAVIKDSLFMAFKDELTGIPSRRALMQKIETLGRQYTLVMSDIDHFKKFNDTYGHDVGDDVLKLVASKLSKVTGGGQAFRFGGEEFVILFPNKIAAQVEPHIETIRLIIAEYDIALRTQPRPPKKPGTAPQKPARDKIVKVTSSFGIAQKSKTHKDFTDVMKLADMALYAAKKAGRNCIKVARQ